MTAANETALTRKAHDRPAVAMSTPARAGPTMRDAFTMMLFRATAFATSSGPAISMTKLWRDGLSMTVMKPYTRASSQTIQTRTEPFATTIHRARAWTVKAVWAARRTFRLSKRSATRPPIGPRKRTGRNWSAAVMPR